MSPYKDRGGAPVPIKSLLFSLFLFKKLDDLGEEVLFGRLGIRFGFGFRLGSGLLFLLLKLLGRRFCLDYRPDDEEDAQRDEKEIDYRLDPRAPLDGDLLDRGDARRLVRLDALDEDGLDVFKTRAP